MAFAVHDVLYSAWLAQASHTKKGNHGSRPKKEQQFAGGKKTEEKKKFNFFL